MLSTESLLLLFHIHPSVHTVGAPPHKYLLCIGIHGHLQQIVLSVVQDCMGPLCVLFVLRSTVSDPHLEDPKLFQSDHLNLLQLPGILHTGLGSVSGDSPSGFLFLNPSSYYNLLTRLGPWKNKSTYKTMEF